MTKRKKREKDKPLPPLSHVPPWEKHEHHGHKVGIVLFIVLAFGLVLGFSVGFQATHDPPVTTTVTGHNGNSTITPANPAPPTSNGNNSAWSPTPTNTSNPHSPPAPSPPATLVYGVVNPAGVNANLSAPGWTLMFNGTNGLFNASLVLQWNQWHTNYWFTYAIVLTSDISYQVTVHEGISTWATVQGSITPSGANFSQNFITTGNPY